MSTATAPTPAPADAAPAPPPPRALAALADTLRVAGNPTRLRIVYLLADGARNVAEIGRLLDDMTQPGVSHHLKLMTLAGVVEPARRGKFIDYALTAKGRAIHTALAALAEGTEGAR